MYLDSLEALDEDQSKMSCMRTNLLGWEGRFLYAMPFNKGAHEETETFTLFVRKIGDSGDPGDRIIAGRKPINLEIPYAKCAAILEISIETEPRLPETIFKTDPPRIVVLKSLPHPRLAMRGKRI